MTQNKRDSMVFYRSFYTSLGCLSARKKEAALKAIIEYGLDGIEPKNLDASVEVAFSFAKPLIDKANKRYENCVKNGRKGGNTRVNNLKANQSANQELNQELNQTSNQELNQTSNQDPNLNDNDNVNVNDNDNVNENVNVNVNDNPPPLTAENVGTRKTARGEYNNVFISGLETVRLINELGYDKFEKSVEFLSGYLIRKPNHKSACHYEDLRGWVQKALVDRGIIPSPEKTELAERYKKQGFDFDFEDIFEQP